MNESCITCPWCAYTCNNVEHSLRIHCAKSHDKTAKQLFDQLNPSQKLCLCGCETPTQFHGLVRGYSDYLPGHHIRVRNPWGHNETALKKSQITRNQMEKAGEINHWSAGLTAHTDVRVAKLVEKSKATKNMQKQRSEHVAKSDANRHISVALLEACKCVLYRPWTHKILLSTHLRCQCCNELAQGPEYLQVFYLKEQLSEIIRAALVAYRNLSFTGFKNEIVAELVLQHHTENQIACLVVCQNCEKILETEGKNHV